eukprot:s3200_g6.t1
MHDVIFLPTALVKGVSLDKVWCSFRCRSGAGSGKVPEGSGSLWCSWAGSEISGQVVVQVREVWCRYRPGSGKFRKVVGDSGGVPVVPEGSGGWGAFQAGSVLRCSSGGARSGRFWCRFQAGSASFREGCGAGLFWKVPEDCGEKVPEGCGADSRLVWQVPGWFQSAGRFRSGSDGGSGRFREVVVQFREVVVQVPGCGLGFGLVLEGRFRCGSGGGSDPGGCSVRFGLVPEGSDAVPRMVPEGSGTLWCRFRAGSDVPGGCGVSSRPRKVPGGCGARSGLVPEGSGKLRCKFRTGSGRFREVVVSVPGGSGKVPQGSGRFWEVAGGCGAGSGLVPERSGRTVFNISRLLQFQSLHFRRHGEGGRMAIWRQNRTLPEDRRGTASLLFSIKVVWKLSREVEGDQVTVQFEVVEASHEGPAA